MKKKAPTQSAFFNPRALLGFALCFLGVAFAFLAFSGLTSRSVEAQATPGKGKAAPNAISAPAPTDHRPVNAVRTRPLREQKMIQPSKAPGHDHPEPIQPPLPPEGPGSDTARQETLGPVRSAPVPTGISFDGVGVGLNGFVPASNPPDVNGRVGATQYVQWNNTSFAVFDKTTGALQYGPAAGKTIFQALGGICATHNDGDPVVAYDVLAGRWILSQFVVGGPTGSFSHQCVAISQTGDATGAYYLYDFLTDGINFVDYPHIGVWPDGYYMSGHVFNAAGTQFLAARLYVFERDKMLSGQPARMVSSNLTGGPYGFLPADLDSLTPPAVGEAEYLLGPGATTALTYSARAAVTWGTTPLLTLVEGVISNTTFSNPPCVAGGRRCVQQPAPATTADYLDNLSNHFMYRLAYRNNGTQAAPQESLLANITVRGSDTTHGALRWYEFRNDGNSLTQPTIFQQSTYDPDTTYRFMGSIAMDKDSNIALGYSTSSTTIKPSITLTGRLAADPLNTMGAETTMTAGLGSQLAAGNRWGDYSSMTVDPVDQCSFYYTNEYLQASGSFNWSTRVASFRFPTCTNAPAWGTVTGTITSSETGAPISGVLVSLSNGYAGASNAAGVYTIPVPAGSYTASAADFDRNCSSATPGSVPVFVTSAGTATQNFTMTGDSKLEANGVTIDDSTGNGNGVINKAECVRLNLGVKNNGCASESAISATVTTSTPGVTIIDASSAYPDMVIDAGGTNLTPFKVSVASDFVCGTNIALQLHLTYASGSKTVEFSIPSCAGGPNQFIPATSLTTSDLVQNDRVGRNGVPSTCEGKPAPGGGFPGTHYYKTWTFTNSGGAPACFTVNITAATGGPGDIESVAYLNSYDPTQLSLNYLGDTGISGLGTTIGNASYSFVVPALSDFVVVVETAGTTASSQFSGTVSGFFDQTPGPGICPAAPPAPVLTGAVSRLGGFDVQIPLGGPLGVEPRDGLGNYTVVLTFDSPVQSGSAAVTSGTGTAGAVSFSGNTMMVSLSGVADEQTITLAATNVTGTNGGVLSSAPVNIGFLIGDTNGDKTVSATDVAQTKSEAGHTVTAANAREDVNHNGAINGTDVSIVKSASGHNLP